MSETTTVRRTLGILLASALVGAAGCDPGSSEGETIGPRGGTIVSDDGRFSLEIPPGALDQDIAITLDEVEGARPDALMTCYEVGPVGLPLLFPAEVTFEVDHDMMEDFGPDGLALIVEKEDSWSLLADRTVDAEAQTVSASAVFLSSYALVAAE